MCVLICLWEPIQGDAHKSEWRDLNGDTNSLQSTVTNASSWWHHAVILAFRFTFMHLLKQTPPLATGRHFFISELLAPPALCLSSIRRRQENHMQWAGLGVWLQDQRTEGPAGQKWGTTLWPQLGWEEAADCAHFSQELELYLSSALSVCNLKCPFKSWNFSDSLDIQLFL